jgi:hypothetical protein
MKLAWWIALGLMLIGFAILFRPPRIDDTMAVPIEPPSQKSVASATELAPVLDVPASTEADAPRVERSALAVAAPVHEGPRTIVTGRCVDEKAMTLAGVDVSLETVGERWSATVSAPYAIVDDRPQFEFHARSDADGRFRFDVPQPDAKSILLVATPGPAQMVLRRTLDHVIGAGDADLGDVCCASAGRITGTVRTPAGAPVEGVLVHAQLERESAESTSDRDGRFLLGHLVAGSWRMEARSPCYELGLARSIDVAAGGDPIQFDFVAEPVPALEGRVVDPDGAPIATATVQAHHGAAEDLGVDTTNTAADGTFKLCLQSKIRAPFTLSAFHSGFVPTDHSMSVVGDERDLVLVMKRSPRMTFRVVDAGTLAPISRYRIELAASDGYQSMSSWTGEEEHARGEVELAVDRPDDVVLVAADDRARLQAAIAPDEPGGSVQTLVMSRGAWITGRALIGGTPAAGTMMSASRARAPVETGGTSSPDAMRERALRGKTWPAHWTDQDRQLTTDAEGRFRFDDLQAGTWILSVGGIGVASRSLPPAHLAAGGSLDMGDVRIDVGPGIEGHITLPEGIDPRYVRVKLDGHALAVNADEQGFYRFAGLEPGRHRVEIPSDTRLGISGMWSDVDLAPNEQRHVDFDLRDSVLAHVHVRVVFAGAPFSAAWVSCRSDDELPSGCSAQTNQDGAADVCAPPRVQIVVDVGFIDRVVAQSAEMTLAPGQHSELEITVDPGALEIVLPQRIQPQGVLTVVLAQRGLSQTLRIISEPASRLMKSKWTAKGQARDPTKLEWVSSRVKLGLIAPGAYSVLAFQHDDTTQADTFRFEGNVTIAARSTSVVDFSDK